MLFYIDGTFETQQENEYRIGIDRIYVLILLNFGAADYAILKMELVNVWLCTTDSNDIITVSQSGDNGGCFMFDIIDENQPYHIIKNTEISEDYTELDTIIYEKNNDDAINDNQARFSFIVPATITRSNLYIHSQIKLQLIQQNNSTRKPNERRRILRVDGNNNVQDQIRHFMDYTNLIIPETTREEEEEERQEIIGSNEDKKSRIIMIGILILVFVVCVLSGIVTIIIHWVRVNRDNEEQERREQTRNRYITT